MAMMAMTTRSSISVNAFRPTECLRPRFVFIFIVIYFCAFAVNDLKYTLPPYLL